MKNKERVKRIHPFSATLLCHLHQTKLRFGLVPLWNTRGNRTKASSTSERSRTRNFARQFELKGVTRLFASFVLSSFATREWKWLILSGQAINIVARRWTWRVAFKKKKTSDRREQVRTGYWETATSSGPWIRTKCKRYQGNMWRQLELMEFMKPLEIFLCVAFAFLCQFQYLNKRPIK